MTSAGISQNGVSQDEKAKKVIHNSITKVIIPGLLDLKRSSVGLQTAMANLCASPSEQNLMTPYRQFGSFVGSWGRIELFRIGSIIKDNRLERILFWLDSRNIIKRQVNSLIRSRNQDAISPQALNQASVAAQGLRALELMLFGKNFKKLLNGEAEVKLILAVAMDWELAKISMQ